MNGTRLVLIVLMAGWIAIGVTHFRSVFNPLSFACGPWLLVLIGQQLMLPYLPLSTTAGFLIGVTLSGFSIGALSMSSGTKLSLSSRAGAVMDTTRVRVWQWLTFGSILVVLSRLALFLYYTLVLRIGVGGQNRVVVYALSDAIEASQLGWFYRALASLVYVGAMIMAFELARNGGRKRRPAVFAAVVIVQGLFIASRFDAILALTIIGVTWAAIRAPSYPRVTKRIFALFVLGAIAVPSFIYFTSARRAGFGVRSTERLQDDTLVGLLGSPSVFSESLERSDEWKAGEFTGLVVKGPLALIGVTKRGRWSEEPVSFAGAQSTSNILTGTRMVLSDFGVVGTCMAFIALGWLVGFAFARAERDPAPRRFAVLGIYYTMLLWMPVTIVSYYVFWWLLILIVPSMVGRMFPVLKTLESVPAFGRAATGGSSGITSRHGKGSGQRRTASATKLG